MLSLSKKLLFSAATLVATTTLSAQEIAQMNSGTRIQQAECCVPTGLGTGPGYELYCICPAYSYPARISVRCGWDTFVSASFIYWFVGQETMDLVSTNSLGNNAQPPVPPAEGNLGTVFQDMTYKPGFKVALGMSFDDDWTAVVEYTRLHMTTTTRKQQPLPANPVLFRTFVINVGWGVGFGNTVGDQIDTLHTKWSVDLDTIDGMLNRWYYSGRKLTLSPFFGLRGGSLNQKMVYDYVNRLNFLPFRSMIGWSNSWYVGPRAGLDANFILGRGFRLTGNVGASLLYQNQKAKTILYDDLVPGAVNFNTKVVFKNVRPNANMGLGLGWGAYTCNERFHFDFLAQYEFNYWWGQNVIRASVLMLDPATQHTQPGVPGDLYFHGLTFTTRFDF